VLSVNGRLFADWKSITVYLNQQEANNYYRFTATELVSASPPKVLSELQIVPGMTCSVTLGGEFAIAGYVWTRQAALTEKAHGVEITGKGFTAATVNGAASVKGGELTNVTYPELATKILEPYGLKFGPKGAIDMKPFERINVTGQTAWEVLETAARQRNIILGTNPYDPVGKEMWGTAKGFTQGFATVEEGVNILEGRETVSMEFGSGSYLTLAQGAPTPKEWGAKITSQPFGEFASGFAKQLGVAGMFMPIVNMLELPGKKADADKRSGTENTFLSGAQIKVEVVVQGWFNGYGQLWRPWMSIHVRSPSLILDEPLICKSVTFTQDDRGGTRTTLELWNEVSGRRGPTFN